MIRAVERRCCHDRRCGGAGPARHEYLSGPDRDAALRRAGNGTYRLRLIHGYRGGTAIRDMLWLTYGRRSQVKRMVSVSEGVTELVLREYY